MIFREVSHGVFERWTGGDVGELRLPPVVEVAANWSDDELEAFGLYRLPDPDPAPAGKVIVSQSVQRVEGVVKWVYDLEDAPVQTVQQRKDQLLAAIRNKRWEVETSGIIVGGAPILTDDKSQARITGAAMLFDKDPELTHVDWEAQPNVWVTVDKDTMLAIGLAVGRHVQACFSQARVLAEAVMAAEEHTDLDAIDIDSGWPA